MVLASLRSWMFLSVASACAFSLEQNQARMRLPFGRPTKGTHSKSRTIETAQQRRTLLKPMHNGHDGARPSKGLDVNEVFSGQQTVGGAAIINHSVTSVTSMR